MRTLGRVLLGVLIWLPAGFVPASEPADFTLQQDVTYRVVDETPLKLDLAIPTGPGPFPAVVFVHGGGWIMGHRSRYAYEIEEAARQGFVAATITYRLSKTGVDTPSVDGFPAALEDVKAAIRYLRTNHKELHVDPKRVGVVGESAGGHLALMAGLTRPSDGFEGSPPADAASSEVQAVVNVSGATDLTALWRSSERVRPALVVLLGGTAVARSEAYRKASPVAYARKDAPPILSIHGSHDGVIPVGQAQRLEEAITKAGGRHTVVILKDAGHRLRRDDYRRSVYTTFHFLTWALKRK